MSFNSTFAESLFKFGIERNARCLLVLIVRGKEVINLCVIASLGTHIQDLLNHRKMINAMRARAVIASVLLVGSHQLFKCQRLYLSLLKVKELIGVSQYWGFYYCLWHCFYLWHCAKIINSHCCIALNCLYCGRWLAARYLYLLLNFMLQN